MFAFALPTLLAQTLSSPFAMLAAGLAAMLGLAVVYLALVSIPMLRSSHNRVQEERDAALIQLEGQSAKALRQLDEQRQNLTDQLSKQKQTLEGRIVSLDSEVTQLKQQAANTATQTPRLKRDLADAKLAAHVNRGLANRIAVDLQQQKNHADAIQRQAQADVAAVKADAATQLAKLEGKLQEAMLDIHVRRGIQQRLESRIHQLNRSLLLGGMELADLRARADLLQDAVRTQSAAMINSRLAEAEVESERLRNLRDQLGSPDLSPQDMLQAIAAMANGRAGNETH